MELDFLVSILAGTIEILYKKALHTSCIVSETLSRAPDSPPPYIALKRSRDYAAPRHDLGSRRAAHPRAQLEPEMSVAAGIVLVLED